MKYAINILRMEEHGLVNKMTELDLKSEEFPVTPQFSGQRAQFAHLRSLNDKRLSDVRKALEKLEK